MGIFFEYVFVSNMSRSSEGFITLTVTHIPPPPPVHDGVSIQQQ